MPGVSGGMKARRLHELAAVGEGCTQWETAWAENPHKGTSQPKPMVRSRRPDCGQIWPTEGKRDIAVAISEFLLRRRSLLPRRILFPDLPRAHRLHFLTPLRVLIYPEINRSFWIRRRKKKGGEKKKGREPIDGLKR